MLRNLIVGVIFNLIGNSAFAAFRCDYTYVPEGGGWFKFHATPAYWHLARDLCQHEGGELAQPTSTAMVQVVTRMMREHGVETPIHTGFRFLFTLEEDNADPQDFRDNSIPVRKKSIVKEQILLLWSNGTLEQSDTFMWFPFVCYVAAGDTVPLYKCGTVDNDYILDKRTDHCYKFHRTRSTFHEALRICGAEGGTLAIINSEEEAEIIKDIFLLNPPELIPGNSWVDSAFVGVMLSKDRVWVNTKGETLDSSGYTVWSPGEPNNARGDEFCGTVGRNGLLFDDPCSRLLPFICEMEKDSLLYCDREKMIEDTKKLLKAILKGKVDIY